MNVSHRLSEFIEYKKLNAHSFEVAARLTKNVIQKPLKTGTGITVKTLCKISESFPDLNMNWVLTGRDTMLVNVFPEMEINEPMRAIVLSESHEMFGEWREKYYAVLEKYTACMEAKEATKKPYAGNGK